MSEMLDNLQIQTALREKFNLTDADFDHHESDLYVKYTPEIYEWLVQNYSYFHNTSKFKSALDNAIWVEIPFANKSWWENKVQLNTTMKISGADTSEDYNIPWWDDKWKSKAMGERR